MTRDASGPRRLAALTDEKVFELLGHGPAARTEISRALGISKPTASQAILRLQRFGLVAEGRSSAEGKRGRIPERYALNPCYGHVLGVELSAQRLALRAADLSGAVLAERAAVIDSQTSPERVLRLATGLLDELAGEVGTPRLATGISQAAPVLRAADGSATVVPTPIFAASGTDLAGLFDPRSTLLDNDVNWMAVAQNGRASGSLLLVYLGAGIGSALMIDGKVHRGRHGLVGELETQRLDGGSLLEQLDRAGLVGTRILYEELADPRRWPALLEPLGRVLGNLIGFLDPDTLVVTGPGASAALTEALGEQLRHAVPLAQLRPEYSEHGGQRALEGALAGARQSALATLWDSYRAAEGGAAAALTGQETTVIVKSP